VWLDLVLGPPGKYTDAELEAGWAAYGDEIMENWKAGGPPSRPWGYWVFELGEEMPAYDDETVRLAELGELTDFEVAALAEDANEAKARRDHGYAEWQVHHGVERGDQRRIDLHERVLEAGKEA
jgi:hypothetical protein